MTDKNIVSRLRGSYRDPEHGVVVVSPKLLRAAADEIERLQGTPEVKRTVLRIYVNRGLPWTANKRAAHAVHAALQAFGVHPGCAVVVLDKGPTKIAEMRTVIHDEGRTEIPAGSLTAGTNWPEDAEEKV